MGRIKSLDMTIVEIISILSDGNPGAATVLAEILRNGSEIDPDAAHPFLNILHFDTLAIYGPHIWMLYKNVCSKNLATTMAILRANQLGYVRDADIHDAINNYGRGLDIEGLCKKVTEQLPNFNLNYNNVFER